MEPNNNTSANDTGKNVGIISYITIIGWLIAYFGMHQSNKTEQGGYQLRQTLLLHIAYFAFYFIWHWVIVALFFTSLTMLWLASTVVWVIGIAFFVLWIIGFIGAINGEKKPMPIIGDMAQNMFKGI